MKETSPESPAALELVIQPKGSPFCGQACVAMLLNISLQESIFKMNRIGPTTIKHLITALKDKYCFNKNHLTRISHTDLAYLPFIAILRVRWNKKESHWILKWGNQIYDPIGYKQTLSLFLQTTGGRITSYLELEQKK